jgi:hypothetical protein
MESGDIVVGQTYLVHVSRRADVARHLTDLTMLAWLISGAEDFDLTVTATGARLDDEPAVTGVRIGETTRVSTPLPRAAASRLGLPADVDYVVNGVIIDAASGRVVSIPSEETLTIPVRWLRSLAR